MKKLWFIKMIVFALAGITVMTAIVMWTWNWLVPELFHGPVITFYQTIGLLILSRLLFRGFLGIGNRGMHGKQWNPWKDRMEKMDPEQREKMRDLWKKRCGGYSCDDEKKGDVG